MESPKTKANQFNVAHIQTNDSKKSNSNEQKYQETEFMTEEKLMDNLADLFREEAEFDKSLSKNNASVD